MRGTANTSDGGRFCGRAVHGVSNLSGEDRRQIEAHRAKDRPTPWAHLALRYGVNEIDLRKIFEPAANDDAPLPVAVVAPPAPARPRNLTAERETLFRELWGSGIPKYEIAARMTLSAQQIDRLRVKLALPVRQVGSKPDSWKPDESRYVLRNYVVGGRSAASVAQELPGRSEWAVVGHAHRMGWTRASHPAVRP